MTDTPRSYKRWTKKEIALLYESCTVCDKKTVARKLGRSHMAVERKAEKLGIHWFRGYWTAKEIASEIGCTLATVSRLIRIIFRPISSVTIYMNGTRRYRLSDDQAERVMRILQATQKQRQNLIAAGIASGVARRNKKNDENQ